MLQYHLLRRIHRPKAYETLELPLLLSRNLFVQQVGFELVFVEVGTIDQPAGAAFKFVVEVAVSDHHYVSGGHSTSCILPVFVE
jgi:hypothetical protein